MEEKEEEDDEEDEEGKLEEEKGKPNSFVTARDQYVNT